jgi:hypothetical protein
VILGPALADVVQQERDVEDLAVDPGLEDRGRQRQVLDQFAAFDLGQDRDGLDDVLVDRVSGGRR